MTPTIEDVLKQIKAIYKENIYHKDLPPAYKEGMDTYNYKLAEHFAASLNRQGWTRVEDGLPKKNGYYICWCIEPSEPGLIHFHLDTGWQNGFYNERVTHWMKLEPPKPSNI